MKTKSGRKIKTKTPTKKVQRRTGSSGAATRFFGRIILPFVICVCLVVCLGAISYLGYQKVAASDFFNVRRVEVAGVERASKANIETIVRSETERTGVWLSDLAQVKADVEKLPFIKSASITKVLPDGIRVQIVEKQPVALANRNGQNYLIDAEGEILAAAETSEPALPFAITGWDETKTEKAIKENLERVKMYQKMIADWKTGSLLSRVESVNLIDLREPRAIVTDSGTTVSIDVGRENFAQNLSNGIKAIVGKGEMFAGVDLVGSNMVLAPRKQN